MKVDLSRNSHVLFFVIFLPLLSFGVGWAFAQLIPQAPFWVESVSPLTAFGLFYAFFERVAWHWPIFRKLGIVQTPDMRGRWAGKQLSTFKTASGKPIESYVVLEVTQTFGDISICAYYKRWNNSHSDSCFMNINNRMYAVTLFESEPNAVHDGDDTTHKGTMRLQRLSDKRELLGDYFNSNGNRGELRLRYKGPKILSRFAE